MAGEAGSLLARVAARFTAPANIDWCEANHVVTPWVAEFYNTMSSLPLAVLPWFGICWCRYKVTREVRWLMAYLLFSCVGIGSFCFHMTLYYGCQAMDELPMLYANLVFMFILFNEEVPASRRPWFPWALAAWGALQTAIYFLFSSLYEVFLLGYVSLVVVCVSVSYRRVHGWLHHKTNALQRRLYWTAIFFYVGGSGVWVLENSLCGVNHEEQSKSDFYHNHQSLHLHAWWHIGSAVGTWLFIQMMVIWRGEHLKEVKEVGLGWAGPIPYAWHHGAWTSWEQKPPGPTTRTARAKNPTAAAAGKTRPKRA